MIQICFMRCIYKRSRSPRHIFRSSRLSLEYPDTFFTSSGNFPVHPYTFQIIRKLSSLSGHFVYYLDILYNIRTCSKISGYSSANNELFAKTFRICKNFPVSIADGGFLTLPVIHTVTHLLDPLLQPSFILLYPCNTQKLKLLLLKEPNGHYKGKLLPSVNTDVLN